jgi:membrane protein DedA with SNARE-associated domain
METLIPLILQYKYFILFPLACFEGPMIAFIVGSLAALGYFDPLAAFLVLILGDVIPDNAYYFFGRLGEKKTLVTRYASKIGITPEHFDIVKKLWFKYPIKTMLLSKFAYGLSTPLLISAGIVNMPFRLFLTYSFILSCMQYSVLLALGYYASSSLGAVTRTFEGIQFLAAGVIAIAVFYYFLTRYMRSKLLQHKNNVEKNK